MSFGATRALDDAGISVRRGEIHALLGQNGSGKSTLVKVLAGYHVPGPGSAMRGRPAARAPLPGRLASRARRALRPPGPGPDPVAQRRREPPARRPARPAGRGAYLVAEGAAACHGEAFARYGVTIDPRSQVADLTPADQALLAIVRAVRDVPSLLVLDEPTALLPPTQREGLLTLLREIVAGGSSILLVSHELGEVVRFADRVTVLRDGRTVGTVDPSVAGSAGLVELVVGRALEPPGATFYRPAKLAHRSRSAGSPGRRCATCRWPSAGARWWASPARVGPGSEELPHLLFGATGTLRPRTTPRGAPTFPR